MKNNPFFSVVIPTYNRAGFIRKTIESVLDQSFQDFEIIVVDDGSTDSTEEVVGSITSDKIHYYKKENAERAAARNFGAKKSKGQYVNFLDSDDIVYANHLQEANEFTVQHKGVEIFHIAYDVRDDHGKLLWSQTIIKRINVQIVHGNLLSCNGVFIRRDVFLENQFNEDRALSSLEDWELWIRMSARFYFANSSQITSAIILHEERSVMTADAKKLKLKADHFVRYVSEDKTNKEVYADRFTIIFSSVYMYTALHLAMIGGNADAVLKYLNRGLRHNFRSIFTKRFLVILKLMIFQQLKS